MIESPNPAGITPASAAYTMDAYAMTPFNGYGLGLRPPHYQAFLEQDVRVDFVEIISENFMVDGGRPLYVLDAIRDKYAVAMHGVSMSVGAAEGIDIAYLERLRQLAERVRPLWVSDHVCWTGSRGFNSHDLLPMPYTEEALEVVCRNVRIAQDVLGRPLLLENPSSYVAFSDGQFSEWAFLTEVCRNTGCFLLLDVNNVFVSASNHGFEPMEFLDGVPRERVLQIHLAGHSDGEGGLLIDTHDREVPDAVWQLYRALRGRLPDVATLIERDDDIPPLDTLLSELDAARHWARAMGDAR